MSKQNCVAGEDGTDMARLSMDESLYSFWRPSILRAYGGVIRHSLAVIAQCDIHEDIAQGGLEAHHERFSVFTGFIALL